MFRTVSCHVTLALLALTAAVAIADDIGSLHCNDDQGQPKTRGKRVTVTGVVTGQFSTEKNARIYVQDATGAINVYGTPKNCVAVGDSVRVTGVVAGFNGLTEITGGKDVTLAVETLGHAKRPPQPLALTIAQVLSTEMGDCKPNESRLVRLENVVLRTSHGDAFADTAVFRNDANYHLAPAAAEGATVLLRTAIGSGCDTTASLAGMRIPGGPVSVTGILSQYTGRDATTGGYQILPRTRDDIRPMPAKQP